MSTDRCTDKDNVVCMRTHTHTHTMEYNPAIKMNEIMLFAATLMDLEIIILSEVRKRYPMIIYMWNLKCDTNELIYKTETDSQT